MHRDILGSRVIEIIPDKRHTLSFIKSACTGILFKHFKPQKVTPSFFGHLNNFIKYELTVVFPGCAF